MEVPFEELNPETLRSLIEHVIGREGTDHGSRLFTMDEKVEQVLKQLRAGKAVVVFDEESDTCDIVTKRQSLEMNQQRKAASTQRTYE